MIKIEKFVNFSNMECKLRFHCTSLCMRFQVINRLSSILFNILFIIFQFLIKIFELFSILDDLSLYKHNFKSDVDVLLRYSNVITSQKFIEFILNSLYYVSMLDNSTWVIHCVYCIGISLLVGNQFITCIFIFISKLCENHKFGRCTLKFRFNESFFDPRSIKIYHILCIFSEDYNVVEVK